MQALSISRSAAGITRRASYTATDCSPRSITRVTPNTTSTKIPQPSFRALDWRFEASSAPARDGALSLSDATKRAALPDAGFGPCCLYFLRNAANRQRPATWHPKSTLSTTNTLRDDSRASHPSWHPPPHKGSCWSRTTLDVRKAHSSAARWQKLELYQTPPISTLPGKSPAVTLSTIGNPMARSSALSDAAVRLVLMAERRSAGASTSAVT
mmetsp:Transcript_37950/g.92374  ORF Transcript_37950/g.92374 Transcript_37950/m.92374 type:complete len:212 (-) Transcript_37950:1489-2124(-)